MNDISYKFPFPTSNRDFVVLILTKETSTEPEARSFTVISIPVQYQKTRGYVRASYVSVDCTTEMKKDGKVQLQWRYVINTVSHFTLIMMMDAGWLPPLMPPVRLERLWTDWNAFFLILICTGNIPRRVTEYVLPMKISEVSTPL